MLTVADLYQLIKTPAPTHLSQAELNRPIRIRPTPGRLGPMIVEFDDGQPGQFRRFQLHRDVDVTGVSGTGIVADGILWPDGTASVRWCSDHPCVVFWDRGWESVEHVHGHNGASRIVWIDEAA